MRWILCCLVLFALQSSAATSQPASGPATTQSSTTRETIAAIKPATLSDDDRLLVDTFEPNLKKDSGNARSLETTVTAAGPNDAIAQQLPTLSQQIGSRLAEDSQRLNPVPSLEAVRQMEDDWEGFGTQVSDWLNRTEAEADRLSGINVELNKELSGWKYTQNIEDISANPDRVASIERLMGQIQKVKDRYATPTKQTRDLLGELTVNHDRVTAFRARLRTARGQAVSNLFDRDTEPLWRTDAFSHHPQAVTQRNYLSLAKQWDDLKIYVSTHTDNIFLHVGFIAALAAATRWMRRRSGEWITQEPELASSLGVLGRPLDTAFALSLLAISWIYPRAPHLLWAIVGFISLPPLYLLLRRLIERRVLPLVRVILLLWLVNTILGLLPSGEVLSRLLLIAEAGIGAILLGYIALNSFQAREGETAYASALRKLLNFVTRVAVLVLLASLLANVFGYSSLARLLVNSLVSTGLIAVVMTAGTRVATALIIGAMHVWPLDDLHLLREHRPMMQQRLRWLMTALGVWLWFWITLKALVIRDPVIEAFDAIVDARFLGGSGPTLREIFVFGFVVFASFAISRFIRFVLREDVYPRVRLARGVPYAISTLLHYSVLLIGLWIAFAALHVNETKFTILVSAFGVGIGFGLQNVVNNFVSGLLLLFERPVQVGDVVELDGGYVGSVSTIGIRASIIRTPDAAEIIVPNSLLISNRVINWTFSTRQRAFTLPITIVAGPDPANVIDLLLESARKTRLILQGPTPQAYLVEFSPGVGIKFELRVWTSQFEDWIAARSDLGVNIATAFAASGIVIK